MRSIVGGAARAAPPQVQPRLDLQAAAGCTWVGDVNVRPEPALPCKDPQLLAQCLINIASNHPRFVQDCGISF